MNLCKCGCGSPVDKNFIKGHSLRIRFGSYVATEEDQRTVISALKHTTAILARNFAVCVKIDQATGCWLWMRGLNKGYGIFFGKRVGGKIIKAHRFAYQSLHGVELSPTVHLDHITCDRPQCCNPSHVKEATPRANTLRSERGPSAINARKTHCIRGHEFTEQNIYRRRDGSRHCATCSRREARERYAKGRRRIA